MHPCHMDTQRKKLNFSWVRSWSRECSTLLGRACSGRLATRILLVRRCQRQEEKRLPGNGTPAGSRAMVLKQGWLCLPGTFGNVWRHFGVSQLGAEVLLNTLWCAKHPQQSCCSVAKPCPTLSSPLDCSTPGSPALHCLPELAQNQVHWVGDVV